MDKGLSLRLGRASTIQDWDVTIPLPESTPEDQASDQAFVSLLGMGVKVARCQGSIHELLYSSTSLTLPDHVRHWRVQSLESQLGELGEEIKTTMAKLETNAGVKDLDVILLRSRDVAHMSLLTLVYRAAPRLALSSIFNGQCVENARAALQRLHGFLKLIQNENGYVPASAYKSVTIRDYSLHARCYFQALSMLTSIVSCCPLQYRLSSCSAMPLRASTMSTWLVFTTSILCWWWLHPDLGQ